MSRIYGVFNQKGGVGKSRVAIDIAASEAEEAEVDAEQETEQEEDPSVLLIDADPQGHATEGIGLKDFWVRKDVPTLYEGLMSLGSINPMDLVQEVPGERFFAIPSNFQMMELDKDLNGERSRETRLLDLVTILKRAFDIIVIDSPSYFGNLTDNVIRAVGTPIDEEGNLLLTRDPGTRDLTKNALDMLRSGLVIPIQAEQTSVRATELLFNQVDVVQVELKIRVNILAMVPNLVQDSGLGRQILLDFRTNLPEKMVAFDFPKRVVFQEAYAEGRTIFTYAPKRQEKMKDVLEMRQLYRDLAALLHERGEAHVQRYV
jgi:chromosome partitioning protein